MKGKTKQWVEVAKEDYENMKFCWKGKRYRLTVFCAQQCVEKILKAYIIETKNIPPPKIHDIDNLIQRANLDITEIGSPDCIDLSQAYIRVRYEDFDKKYYTGSEKVQPLVNMAETIYIWVRDKLIQS